MNEIRLILIAILISFAPIASVNAAYREVPSSKEQVIYSYAPLVKKASGAVVNIYTKKKVRVQSGFSPFMNDPLFQKFF